MNKSINEMIKNIIEILGKNIKTVYIYGSYVYNDFKYGWSDIDILVLTKEMISDDCAKKLLYLREDLLIKQPKNKYYRSFEGAFLSLSGFLNCSRENVVYWGTKGERIIDSYKLDSFSMKELIESGKLVYGIDIRKELKIPTYLELYKDVYNHYLTIREHAKQTGRTLYSYGWFLDISRCIYTLETGEIISKTKAGAWALKNKLCPDEIALKAAIKVRKSPQKLKNKQVVMDYAETLGDSVQRYADILEKYLKKHNDKIQDKQYLS